MVNNGGISYWFCPVCKSPYKSSGELFSGSRSVSLHIAGKVRTGDRLHRSWAINKVGNVIDRPEVRRTINTLGDRLEWYVIEDNRNRRQQEEENREQSKTEEDPKVVGYKYIKTLETNLHGFVRLVLQFSFGKEESGWWVQGVPLNIRTECAQRCEVDGLKDDKYKYTDLIDLKTILDKNWKTFAPYVPQTDKGSNSKGDFLEKIAQTNEVRRKVMHPIRSDISTEDISFLEQFSREIDSFVQGMY